jgi:hypothetical protein
MTDLNYSNLPPDAQKAIQKLTGSSHEELEGKSTNKIMANKTTEHKVLKTISKYTLKGFLAALLLLGISWGILFLVIYLSAR